MNQLAIRKLAVGSAQLKFSDEFLTEYFTSLLML